jgi:hypothetical protein
MAEAFRHSNPGVQFAIEFSGTGGDVTGTGGGGYAGRFQITPVPLPAALPLLLSGLGGLCRLFARRRNAPGAHRGLRPLPRLLS